MWRRTVAVTQQHRSLHVSRELLQATSRPVIDIRNGTFYRRYPSTTDLPDGNPALFPDLTFSLAATRSTPQYWSIISPSSIARTTFLQILAGQHICIPPTARSYPYLSDISETPQHAIKYVGFDADRGSSVGGTNVRGAYLSARYESRREETDFTVLDYLTGHTELNALEHAQTEADRRALEEATAQLNLQSLLFMPVANLSNGQTRRARIAKALMARPEVLLLDGPFMGLDPNTLVKISTVLKELAQRQRPRLIMSLRPEDGVPEWVDHLVIVDDKLQVVAQGSKHRIFDSTQWIDSKVKATIEAAKRGHESSVTSKLSRDGFPQVAPSISPSEALVEMEGVKVAYGNKIVLGDWSQPIADQKTSGLWWSLHRGQRCGIFGANGSGKTTMLSLITSDHPQTYSLPIKLFGRSRLPRPGLPGISVFDIQQRMGHSSPEVHAFFPRQLTVRRALESAWADTPLTKPQLSNEAKRRVSACLRWFAKELHLGSQQGTVLEVLEHMFETSENSTKQLLAVQEVYKKAIADETDLVWANDIRFRELSFSSQRLVLFLRAIIKNPDLVILDEALSGVDETTRDKALLFLSQGEAVSSVEGSEAKESILAKLGQVTIAGLLPQQALLVISHSKEDVPGCLREWICLPEPGEGRVPRAGTLPGPLELNPGSWNEIWGKRQD